MSWIKLQSICFMPACLFRLALVLACVMTSFTLLPELRGQSKPFKVKLYAFGGEIVEKNNRLHIRCAEFSNLSSLPRLDPTCAIDGIDISWCSSVDGFLRQALQIEDLSDLNLAHSDVKNAFRFVEKLPELEKLNLQNTSIERFEFLGKINGLKELNLRGTIFRDSDIEYLRNLRDLEVLDLSETEISFRGLAELSSLPKLRYLGACNIGIVDRNYEVLKSVAQLQEVQLGYSHPYLASWRECGLSQRAISDIENSGIKVLGSPSVSKKTQIVLEAGSAKKEAAVSWHELQIFEPADAVTSIDLSKFDEVDDESIEVLARFRNLRRLSLSGTRITDDAFKILLSLQGLEWLDLSNTRVSDFGLKKHWPSFRSGINEFIANDTYIAGTGFDHHRFPKLQSLTFARTASARWPSVRMCPTSTQAGIRTIGQNSSLQKVKFTWCDALDDYIALQDLSSMPSLMQVDILGKEFSTTDQASFWLHKSAKLNTSSNFPFSNKNIPRRTADEEQTKKGSQSSRKRDDR